MKETHLYIFIAWQMYKITILNSMTDKETPDRLSN